MLFLSCDFFSEKEENTPVDTIIDFKKVDVSPSFKICKNLINQAKTNCFRKQIHQKISESLQEKNFLSDEVLNEQVTVYLLIDKHGVFKLKKIVSSKKIKDKLPVLDSLIRASVQKLPKIKPAIKRGIPVNTQYKLPLQIQSN